MARKSGSNLAALLVGGFALFVIGRCSAVDPEPERPASLMAPAAPSAADAAVSTVAAQPSREAPWSLRASAARQAPAESAGMFDEEPGGEEAFSCAGKRYCREMDSCGEARFYLEQCGLGRLDGDGDGVPCEAIC